MNSTSILIEKYLKNQCSEEEIKELLSFFGKDTNENELKELLLSKFSSELDNISLDKIKSSDALKNADNFIANNITHSRSVLKRYSFIKYAAAVVIFYIGGLLVYNKYFELPKEQLKEIVVSNAKPGTNRATLKLSSGESISLGGNSQSKELPTQISNPENGLLVYKDENDNALLQSINELSTPAGGKYELVLADGTRVTLNSLSSLKYPQQFSDHERVVELTGEAYFDVVKTTIAGKKVPFLVKTSKQTIEVLGTKFNISSYNDDALQKTTLISGKVNVLNPKTGEKYALLPGQQAITDNAGITNVSIASTESAISWVSGNFMFEDVYLKDILKQLARWYDVKVDYNDIPKTRYNILLSRNEDLKTVLKILEDAGKIKINFFNNTISINKP